MAPPLRSGAKQLGPLPMSRAYLVQPEPAWCLRYAPDTNLAFAGRGMSSQSPVLGVKLEQPLQEEKLHTISQRTGSVANPCGRAGGNRKQCGFRALTAISVRRRPNDLRNTRRQMMKPLILFSFFLALSDAAASGQPQQFGITDEGDGGSQTDIALPPADPCLLNPKLPQCK